MNFEMETLNVTCADSVFVPQWKREVLVSSSTQGDRCLFLLLESQKEVVGRLSVLIPSEGRVLLLQEGSSDEILKSTDRFDRIVFFSDTRLTYETHTKDIISFLEFLKSVVLLRGIKLDIVSVRSIFCPFYGAPLHPDDAVFVGLGQTLAQEIDVQVRVFVLEELNDIKWVINGNFPARCPIVISKNYFFLPALRGCGSLVDYDAASFRTEGTYMIIGGNGGLGGMMARYLARKYHSNLVLVGRSPPDSAKLEFLKQLGAKSVCYEQASVGDFARIRSVFDK